ncbi:hypothetical protein ACVRWT_00585 [Streptococcus porcinus]|uniref:Phage protein n=1 Tax=Streptococcus porcinus TaxID=1340 RepID=A0A4V0H7G4_STRPO|nr:hypothetical protein [Streptococcus porcinus]VTT45251.1 phage protein [Streptococcus porcinus]VTT46760.1 phage protein [Streptococcus porcinus]
MKKVLLLAIALFSLGIAQNVMAEEEVKVSQETSQENLKWELDPNQQKVTDDNGQPINIGITGNDISIPLPQGWSVSFRKDNKPYSPRKVNERLLTEYLKPAPNNQTRNDLPTVQAQNTSIKVLLTKDSSLGAISNNNQGASPLSVRVTVDTPTKSPSTLSVSFRSNDGFWAGSIFLRDSQNIRKEKEENEKLANEKRKKREEEQKLTEQKLAEEAYLKYIEYDNNQPWHKRLRDGLQDQLWNFKDWLKN